jgi:hypothetical protein
MREMALRLARGSSHWYQRARAAQRFISFRLSHLTPDYYGPVGYGPLPWTPNWFSNRAYPHSNTPPHAAANSRQPGPTRSTTAKTGGPTGAEQKAEVKFNAAQAVQTLTREDLAGLSYEQIKQLREY